MKQFLKLLRVHQYSKNAFVFIPAFFGGVFFETEVILKLLAIFAAFCCLSSVVYILNDICDRKEDANHPQKKFRPIASGKISVTSASLIAVAFLLAGLLLPLIYGWTKIAACLALYLVLNLFYTLYGKHQAILDVILLAFGFVIRVVGGNIGAGLYLSPWLVLMVFLLSIFLALGKRWHDLSILEADQSPGTIRKSLNGYSRDYLLVLLTFFSTINTICYIVYSIFHQPIEPDAPELYFFSTSVWVVAGNMRYLQIIFVRNDSYSPTQTLIYDPIIRLVVLAWGLHAGALIYLCG